MKYLKKILVCGLLLFFAGFVYGAKKDFSPRFALVIGNQNYDQSGLDNPIQDAKLMRDVLRESGFEVDCYFDLTQEGFKDAVGEYVRKVNDAGKDAVSLFYYSGHGVQIENQNYLVPVDDSKITDVTSAELQCFGVNRLVKMIKTDTQIVILDACRNNPFSNKKQNFAKGLTTIDNVDCKNFIYLFSTQAGQTAEDGGENGNSLFTSELAKEIKKTNLSVNTVFSNVSLNVAHKSQNRQKPLYTGTSVNFEFMNEDIANWQIQELKEQSAKLEVALAKKTITEEEKKNYKTENDILAAQIKLMEEKKQQSKEDAEIKEKEKKEQEERARKIQKETEQQRKVTEKLKRQAQEDRARKQSSQDFIEVIEGNKARLQEIRTIAYEKVLVENENVDVEIQNKIDDILNEEHSITEKDSNGNLIKEAQKKQDAKIAEVRKNGENQKKKNIELFHEPIEPEEKDLLEQISKDCATLKNRTYIASSYINELYFEVRNQYDGGKKKWEIGVYSTEEFFGSNGIITEEIDVPYAKLAQKNESDAAYQENVEVLDTLLKTGNESPFEVRVEYKLKASTDKPSAYSLRATKLSVYYHPENESEENGVREICVNSKVITTSREIYYPNPVKVLTIEELLDNYYKEKATEARKEQIRQNSERTKENINRVISSASSSLSMLEDYGGIQYAPKGLFAALGREGNSTNLKAGYLVPLGDNFFAGPFALLGIGTVYEAYQTQYENYSDYPNETAELDAGLGGVFGFSFTANVDDENAFRFGLATALRLDTLNIMGLSPMISCEYLYDNQLSMGGYFGLDFAIKNGIGYLFGVQGSLVLDF